MTKQWKKSISFRQTQGRKLMLGFVHFGVYMIPLALLVRAWYRGHGFDPCITISLRVGLNPSEVLSTHTIL